MRSSSEVFYEREDDSNFASAGDLCGCGLREGANVGGGTVSTGLRGRLLTRGAGKPLARTEVSIDLIEGKNVRETYATGSGRNIFVRRVGGGAVQLLAKRRGYVSQSYKGHGEYFTAIVVGPGLKSEDVRFAMTAGGSIVGHVWTSAAIRWAVDACC